VTLYDLIFEVATRLEPRRAPPRPSFTRQIYPLLERHVRHEWVNAGFLDQFGWGSAGDFLEPRTLARLGDSGEGSRFLREEVFRRFRDPRFLAQEGFALPPYYGDAITIPPTNPRCWMAVLESQYRWLNQWAAATSTRTGWRADRASHRGWRTCPWTSSRGRSTGLCWMSAWVDHSIPAAR
jgi:hypothetical protein